MFGLTFGRVNRAGVVQFALRVTLRNGTYMTAEYDGEGTKTLAYLPEATPQLPWLLQIAS